MKYTCLLIVFFYSMFCSHGQESSEDKELLDSLNRVLSDNAQSDTAKVNALSEISEVLYFYNPDTLLELSSRQEKMVVQAIKKTKNPQEIEVLNKGRANALNNKGVYYGDIGDSKKGLEYFFKALEVHKETNDPKGRGSVVNNIAMAFENQGDVTRALEFYNQSLIIRENEGDLAGKAITLYNIAYIYGNQNENDQALQYFLRSLEIEKSLGSDIGKAYCYNSIGEVYVRLDQLVKAKSYIDSSFQLRKEIGDELGLAQSYENYADIQLERKEYALALENFKKAYNIRRESGLPRDLAFNMYNIGLTYLKVDRVDSAMVFARRSEKIANEINSTSSKRNIAHLYYEIYRKKDEPGKALDVYRRYIWLRDSLQNAETQRSAILREAQYSYEKKQAKDSIRYENEAMINEAMIDKKNAEIDARRNQQYLLFGGLSLSIVFGLFVYNRFRVTSQQNKIIEVQRETSEMQRKVVETKNREITDSINYAKRIQEAILPPKQVLEENLVDGFVLFKPKDVVSGDFYWLERTNGYIFFAAADCTGHGVPGAMVSVVCSNALSKCVLEEGITDTADLLNRTREIVIEQLNKSGETVNDGMDISLVAVKESERNLEQTEIQWSGANNALWIIRNNSGTMETIKPDKQPVGTQDHASSFTPHTIKLSKGDQIYLFTDGYADQFGGEHLQNIPEGGKKFKSKRFRELLLSIESEDMNKKRERLDEEFRNWKGQLEQVDDVCVIGVRF